MRNNKCIKFSRQLIPEAPEEKMSITDSANFNLNNNGQH
jgi:hypothetical protein